MRAMKTKVLLAPLLGALAMGVGVTAVSAPSAAQTTMSSAPMKRAPGSSFTYAGNRIFYQVAGHGEPIVLIHGYPLSGELFRHQRTGLADRFQAITLDLPGFGRSEPAKTPGTIGFYAKTVVALMDHLHLQKAIIGGHSMGGVITMELYREVPARFAGMILIDTNPMPAPIIGAAEWNAYATQAQAKGIASTVPLLLPQMLTGMTRLGDPGEANELKAIVMQASVGGFVAGGHALADRSDYRAMLKTVSVPTLILVGQEDALWPYEIDQQMHAAIPGSTLVIVPGAAHASIFEKPVAANKAIGTFASGPAK